jgi:hypothetical protein
MSIEVRVLRGGILPRIVSVVGVLAEVAFFLSSSLYANFAICLTLGSSPGQIKLTKPVVASYLNSPFTEGILILRDVKVPSGAFHIAIGPAIVMGPEGLSKYSIAAVAGPPCPGFVGFGKPERVDTVSPLPPQSRPIKLFNLGSVLLL